MLARRKRTKKSGTRLVATTSTDGCYPASASQERLWFLEKLEGDTVAYHLPFAVRLRGDVDVRALERAAQALVNRHSALRTSFPEGAKPTQRVESSVPITLHEMEVEGDGTLPELLRECSLRPFDLRCAPLVRFVLLRCHAQLHVLHINVHHIVADGLSLSILFEDLLELYQADVEGRGPELPALTYDFKDFVGWQREALSQERATQMVEYWTQTLAGSKNLLELPTDRPRPTERGHSGANHAFEITGTMADRIRGYAQSRETTTYVVMLAAFYALLARYSRTHDIVVGTPVANRDVGGVERVIGFFANTLALRARLSPTMRFGALVDQVKTVVGDALRNQELPFDRVVEALSPPRSSSYTPIFQVAFSFQQQRNGQAVQVAGLELEPQELGRDTAKFDMVLEVQEVRGTFQCDWEFSTELFDAATVERMSVHYRRSLETLLAEDDIAVLDVPMLTPEETKRVHEDWNGSTAQFPTACFPDAFDEQVLRTPEAIAVEMLDQQLTYRELAEQANGLAAQLVSQGIGLEDRIALFLPREIDVLVAMIAIWKAGACFVPLNPDSPPQRSAAILEQCRPSLVVTDATCREALFDIQPDARVFDLDVDGRSRRPHFDNRAHPRGLAYVIYTSGSTGVPKGAMIEHEGMTNHLWLKISDLGITANDRIGEIAVTTFDVSIWQYVCGLLVGACTVVYRGDASWVPDKLFEETRRGGVTILESVPSHTKILLDELETNAQDVSCLRMFICNGEPLPAALCRRFFASLPTCALVNAYGATETSDDTSHLHIPSDFTTTLPYMPVSGILPNLTTYILDSGLQPVPVGVVGEVYIGGIGVGRGYFEDPRKTAQSYVPDHLSGTPGARLYKIGDLARYHDDGAIEFIGRVDFQIKIRGLRVELSEIEKVLADHADVRECIVTAHKIDDDYTLTAYLVTQGTVGAEDLAQYCGELLPDYMVPAHLVLLDQFPLTENGKIDRKALPAPDFAVDEGSYVAPSTDREKALCEIWRRVLGREKVGVDDSFFRIGGHSLLAVELANSMTRELKIETTVRDIFQHPTIRELAQELVHVAATDAPQSLRRVTEDGVPVALAPPQVAIWFTYLLDPTSPVYNVNFCELFFADLDTRAFVAAWQDIIDRHDVFRTRFGVVDGVPMQWLGPRIVLDVDDVVVDRTQVAAHEIHDEANRLGFEYGNAPFDLEHGPLLRLKLVAYPDGKHQLIFTTHHIVWDETSTINLIQELAPLYNARRQGEEANLEEIAIGYLDYAHWIDREVGRGAFAEQEAFWRELYTEVPQPLELPTDRHRPALQTFNGATAVTWIDEDATAKVRRFVESRDDTLFIYFLSVLELYLARICDQEDFVIGAPIANRSHPDVGGLFGLFATPLPVRSSVLFEDSVEGCLTRTKARWVNALSNADYPCNRLIESLVHQRDLSRPKLFSIMYGLQNNKTEVVANANFEGSAVEFRKLYSAEDNAARFDLTFVVDEIGEAIAFKCIYNADLFDAATIESMLTNLVWLAQQLPEHTADAVKSVPIVAPASLTAAREGLVGERLHISQESLEQRFDAQVDANPKQLAIIDGEIEVTYQELRARANRVASFLAQAYPTCERIALIGDPSASLVVATMACLKAGLCYIPISPDTPAARVQSILEQGGATLAVRTDSRDGGALPVDVLTMAELEEGASSYEPTRAPKPSDPEQLVYVLFTSGTTGRPKGIPIAQRGLCNLLSSHQVTHKLAPSDRVLFMTPFSFDAAVLEVFWPLCEGATLCTVEGDRKDVTAILRTARTHRVSVLQSVPLLLEALVDTCEAQSQELPAAVRLFIVGGAALSKSLAARTCARFGRLDGVLANHYGPTEVTVDATLQVVGARDGSQAHEHDSEPIGRPLHNCEARVVDRFGNPVPLGVPGELEVASPGLSPGYLNDTAKTQAAFVSRESHDGRTRTYYRTGDLVRLLPSMDLQFCGRLDKQVKIAGNRIELEEVEVALTSIDSIRAAVVKAADDLRTLTAHVELSTSMTTLEQGGHRYKVVTCAQRPDLRIQAERLHLEAWPAFAQTNDVVRQDWPQLYRRWPEYQILVLDGERVIAVGNTIPMRWDGTAEGLPSGWDDMVRTAATTDVDDPNCLGGLAGVVDSEYRGRRLSGALLQVFAQLAHARGFESVLIAVRPSQKVEHPQVGFEAWCTQRRDDGKLSDAWLRTHENVGAHYAGIATHSQVMRGTVAQWEEWCGTKLERTGSQHLPGTLVEAQVDLDAGTVQYTEPAAWFVHNALDGPLGMGLMETRERILDTLRTTVPDYMLPAAMIFHAELPTTAAGKIDEQRLKTHPGVGEGPMESVHAGLEQIVADVWQSVLGEVEIGRNSDFFNLGGQSLQLVRVVVELRERLGVKLDVIDVYKRSTVEALSTLLERRQHEARS